MSLAFQLPKTTVICPRLHMLSLLEVLLGL
jgi:hypothetical protein